MRARPAGPVVSIGSCSALYERASQPHCLSAIASSAVETISPVARSASISRASGSAADFAREFDQAIRGIAHRGDDDRDLVPLLRERMHLGRDGVNPRDGADRGAAVFLDDQTCSRGLFQVSAGIGRPVVLFRRSIENSAETSARLGRRSISSL